MRRLFKSLVDLSLFQQMSVIVVTLGVILVLFFTVYQRGNIDDFVTTQVISLLHRSQENVSQNYDRNEPVKSDLNYDDDVIHFVYVKDKCVQYHSEKIVGGDFIELVDSIVKSSDLGTDSTFVYKNVKYFYYLTVRDNDVKIISMIDDSYGKAIESTLLSSVSNNSAVVFGFIFILLTLWVTTIITPVLQMQNYIEKVKKGDENATLNIDRKDEIGELAVALVSMRNEIKKQEAVKEELIHNISHDLKTPIATIKSYAESIKDGIYPYDTLEKSVDVIIENADRLEKKVYSLLFLNRLEYMMSQEKDLNKTTDMNATIDNVLLSMKMIRPEVEIVKHLQPATFRGEQESWRIVISNILDNAFRYASSNITITLSENELMISNDGPSLSKERVEKLFKPFEKGSGGKFGLGLSICYKVCNNYGYSIVAENLEKGVIFRISDKQPTKKEKKPSSKKRRSNEKENKSS